MRSTGPIPRSCAFEGIVHRLISPMLTDPRVPPHVLTPGSCVLRADRGCDVGMTAILGRHVRVGVQPVFF